MKVFIDANVLVAVLNQEYPRFDLASRVLSLADSKKFTIFTSSLAISISFYLSSKKSSDTVAYNKIKLLSKRIEIASNKSNDLERIFENKKIHDVEDGLQYFAALNSKNKVIITYDLNDFYFSDIEVLNPKDFLLKYAL